MTALSLSLAIPESLCLFGVDPSKVDGLDLEELALNAQRCRAFLFSLDSLLKHQWDHYRHHIDNNNVHGTNSDTSSTGSISSVFKGLPTIFTRRRSPERVSSHYFACARSTDEKQQRLCGSGVSGGLCDFVYRLVCHSRCTVECYPLALALLDRFLSMLRKKELYSEEYVAVVEHIPLVFAVLLLITAKYRDDDFRSNRYFTRLAEISLSEWNTLERFILEVLQYDVQVSHRDYVVYENLVLKEMARFKGRLYIPISSGCSLSDERIHCSKG